MVALVVPTSTYLLETVSNFGGLTLIVLQVIMHDRQIKASD